MDYVIRLLADGLVVPLAILAVVALIVYVPNRDKFTMYSRMLVAGLTSYLIAKLMALVYQPNDARPFEVLGIEPGAAYLNNPGFPSDHVLLVWVIVFALWYGLSTKRWIVVLAGCMAVGVSIGRVLALVHAPIDVVGGLLAAAIGALWYLEKIPKLAKK